MYADLSSKLKDELVKITYSKLTQANLDNSYKILKSLNEINELEESGDKMRVDKSDTDLYRLYDDMGEFIEVKKHANMLRSQGDISRMDELSEQSLGNLISALAAFKGIMATNVEHMTTEERKCVKKFSADIMQIVASWG